MNHMFDQQHLDELDAAAAGIEGVVDKGNRFVI
jgi:hypothetical protein